MLPLAVAACFGGGGGAFRTLCLSQHAITHIEVLRSFLDVDVGVDERRHDDVVVRIGNYQ
jgi:hypothetical protein